MEYSQELDKIKTEVTNSGKKLEDLSKSIQNLSSLTKLQESITNFQEDNVLNRIETKIDILAQTDYFELFNFSIDNLKDNLTVNNDVLSQKMGSVEKTVNHFSNDLKQDILTNLSDLDTKIAELNENISSKPDFELIKNSIQDSVQSLHSNFDNLEDNLIEKNQDVLTNLSNIDTKIAELNENVSFKQDFELIKNSIQDSVQCLHSNFDNLKENLIENNDVLSQKIGSVEETVNHFSNDLKQDILTNLSDLDTKIAELNENISSKQDFELIKNSIQDSVQSSF